MSIYPSPEDLPYEEELLRNPYSLKPWWRYLVARREAPLERRFMIYERALKALPGSYKLWYAYLTERLNFVRTLNRPITGKQREYDELNKTFKRALITMHKMPRVWVMYLESLASQRLITETRRAADEALRALPVSQHDRVWELYLKFVRSKELGWPIETCLRVYRRYLMYDPGCVEEFIDFLVGSGLWQEAAEKLGSVLNDDEFCSSRGKTKHALWLELCDLVTRHANEVSGFDVDAFIRGGIGKFGSEVGRLWASLAGYYVRMGLFDKARDVLEEGMATVITVQDFCVIFDAYLEFEHGMAVRKMEENSESECDGEEEEGRGDDQPEESSDLEVDIRQSDITDPKFEEKVLSGFWLRGDDDKIVDLMMVRIVNLIDRRPELLNTVLLRQNPHNVEQWHRRVTLFKGDPGKQISTYDEAVRTVDPMKAVGKPHSLWIAFAKLYEEQNDLANARVIFGKAVQGSYKTADDLASVWCEWAEMEMRHKNFKAALELLRRATAEPSVDVKRRVAAAAGANEEAVQMKLHKSLRLWSLYVDLEESLGTLESTRAVYERILDLRIATPLIIINYACLLEENRYFEDAFKVYERGVKIFKYPHVKDIWVTYLSKFLKRYGKTNLERVRELFNHAVETTPADCLKPLYLQYAKLEEEYGLAKRAMEVYDQAAKSVPDDEKLGMYEIYIARAAEIFGASRTREIYQQAIDSGLPGKDVTKMCLQYAEQEKKLGEIHRARGIYGYASQFADPRSDQEFWGKWHDFEVLHGNEDTFREMLRINRTVSATFMMQTHFVPPENTMQQKKDQGTTSSIGDVHDKLKQAGLPEDEMEKQSAPLLGFVSAGVQTQTDGRLKVTTNPEEIELLEEIGLDDDDNDEKIIKIARKDVPSAVFGGLVRKRDDAAPANGENRLGALQRIKRLKR